MSVQPDSRSPLTEIDLILSRVISSLVSPRDVSIETIDIVRQELERARSLARGLSSSVSPVRWHLGIEATDSGVKAVFFRESGGELDLYPLAWSLDNGESDRLPREQVDRALAGWLADLPDDTDSWLSEALRELSGIWITAGEETDFQELKNALIAAGASPAERIHRVDVAIASALAYIPLDPLPEPETLLVIHGGKHRTEFALLEVPSDPRSLSRSAIALSSFRYGEEDLVRDTLREAIYPRWGISFPSDPPGESLLEAARLTLLVLRDRPSFTSRLGGREWTVSREELQERVFRPFVAGLKRAIENLERKPVQSPRVICSGDFFLSLWPLVAAPLAEEFPNCPIVPPIPPPAMAPVIIGLGRVPLFPGLADGSGNND